MLPSAVAMKDREKLLDFAQFIDIRDSEAADFVKRWRNIKCCLLIVVFSCARHLAAEIIYRDSTSCYNILNISKTKAQNKKLKKFSAAGNNEFHEI